MKAFWRMAPLTAAVLGLAVTAGAQDKPKKAPNDAAMVAAMEKAMNPGEGQKRLEFMVGTFDVKIRTWVDPSKPPIESTATSVATWVLGNRYVQQMLSGHVGGEPWNGIVYAGFDNISKKYVATYMDSGSTGMDWFTGAMDADGKAAKMTATIHDAITLKPVKVMELHYTRKQS
jgi:hypothetical protein